MYQTVEEFQLIDDKGQPFVIRKGDRVRWINPAGLQCEVTAEIKGITIEESRFTIEDYSWGRLDLGACLLEFDPCEKLRELANMLRESAAKLPPLPTSGYMGLLGVNFKPEKSGLDGDGGPVIVTGDGMREAVRSGNMTKLDAKERLPLDDRTDIYRKRFLAHIMAVPESKLDTTTISVIAAFRFMANELQEARERSGGKNVLVLDARHTIAIDTILDAFGGDRYDP